jgi:type VI protein secretion system component VasF
MSTAPMNLVTSCEPVFQAVCRLNRSARKSVAPPPEVARRELKAALADAKSRAGPALAEQFSRIEVPLLYFIDGMVRTSKLPFARGWSDLAAEKGKTAGDEEFFDLLDETLRDPSDAAAERLHVFGTCLGLGFTGWYSGQPEYLRKKAGEIQSRLRAPTLDPAARICPDAYERVNTADLVKPPSRTLAALAITIVGLGLTVFAANAALYVQNRADLRTVLDSIIARDPAPPSAPPSTSTPTPTKPN